MKVILFMAMSADGIIAGKDGNEDFLSHGNWDSFAELVRSCRNFIVGRKTFETVKKWDEEYGFDDFKDAAKIVVSGDDNYKLDEGYFLASSPKEALGILEEKGLDRALLEGGRTLNSSFARENLIDEIILNIEPVIIGEGVTLFSGDDFKLDLKLVGAKELPEGIVQLRYEVKK